ncbi:hypothetical protein AGABI1DRAFT_95331 [Agaricus bisporus var. burnettii JB137-S8]|uniref:Actin-like ATPase domain-containing protein n=1 Tax=Agaricus bisporus var. burnettii (strain JB137-S8 / ATCC MYA-4627 / FGSC 10392) TaxID=597362 RepID=K5WVM2_AGABU|nr:uncharacterized protein AGABI1DRAFT_95331 [Agaricus bisporus var. burnettii JB137-S8]EKM74838.1 hypothetical protein AGABI1DRAFT_95331 [Agaricus bisporus var. burnettii JB137-S8]
MPAPKAGPALFLGIELSTDQLRASIVDESLELVGVESVDFDTELDYQTQGGIFTTPGDAFTTPVEMWIKGLDLLLAKLARNHDLARVKSIGGAAQHALVWWKSTTVPSLSSLDPNLLLHEHFSAHTFSLPNTPVFQDTASHAHALVIEDLLLGPERMAARVGTAATPSMVSAQLLRVRETWQHEVWARTGRIQLASAFLCSLLSGKWISMGEAEACATGMWVHANTPGSQGHWDEGVLDIVGGSREEGRRVRGWLGDVDTSGGGRRAGNVSRYLVERYRFDPETLVAPFTSDYLANYLSLCPSPNDAILSFGPMDMLLTPAQHYMPTRLYNLFPHPAQDSGEKRRYIAVLCSRNADVPRALVRDMYTKSWSAFDRLVAIVPPGGSIGLDDKLFSFWHLQADSYPYSHVKGIYRFETGVKVNEFRDLRANPRCLLESQVLSFRVKWSHMLATGALGSPRRSINANTSGSNNPQTPPPFISSSSNRASTPSSTSTPSNMLSIQQSLGLLFDPYDHSSLPTRIIATGAAANFPSIANVVGDIFNAPVFVPNTQVDSAQIVPHRNAPVVGFPGRAALGGAYVARWVWGKERGSGSGMGGGGGLGAFEDEIRRLLQKRWIATGGVPLRTNVGGVTAVGQQGGGGMASSGLLGLVAGAAGLLNPGGGAVSGNSGANSGSNTPFSSRSVGATLIEEEEEELVSSNNGMMYGLGISSSSPSGVAHDPAIMAMGVQGHHASTGGYGGGERMGMRTSHTGSSSTLDTLGSVGSGSVMTNSTTYTTPDITSSLSMVGLNINNNNSGTMSNGLSSPGQQTTNTNANANSTTTTTTNPTPLTPVVALPTLDSETQLGLAKVAEADTDAFLSYAAIVPEFCRLEGMLVKGIV